MGLRLGLLLRRLLALLLALAGLLGSTGLLLSLLVHELLALGLLLHLLRLALGRLHEVLPSSLLHGVCGVRIHVLVNLLSVVMVTALLRASRGKLLELTVRLRELKSLKLLNNRSGVVPVVQLGLLLSVERLLLLLLLLLLKSLLVQKLGRLNLTKLLRRRLRGTVLRPQLAGAMERSTGLVRSLRGEAAKGGSGENALAVVERRARLERVVERS